MPTSVGFRFSENMYGTYRAPAQTGPERRFMFHIDAVASDLRQHWRDGRVEATGFVEADGLAAHAPIKGFMILAPWIARFIRYEFEFTADDGRACRFAGEKTIRHLHPVRTWQTLPGAIYDADGKAIASALAYFDRRQFLSFLRTFKPVRAGVRPQAA